MQKVADKQIMLWGAEGAFTPGISTPETRDVEALRLFQSFLCNSADERTKLSNVIMLWETVPKYSGEILNSVKNEELPNAHEVDFAIADHPFKMTLFPGTYYPTKNSKPLRRYPGAREQAVEQALIHLACDQAEMHRVDGETLYRVQFSIRDMARVLKAMGSTLSHAQVRQALEVLSSTIMTIKEGNDQRSSDKRHPILPSFDRIQSKEGLKQGKDVWRVQLHPLVSHAIRNVTYRQYPLSHTFGFTPYASYLIRQMHYLAPNISPAHPFTFRIQALRATTPGLNHKKISGSINALKRELEKMKVAGLLEDFHVEEIFPKRRPRGRPSPIDAEFTLHPGKDWIQHVMAGSRRMGENERTLGLPRSQRKARQETLPLL
ncbi:hypothetical protein VRRI112168_15560 [Vreelandella rituensis]